MPYNEKLERKIIELTATDRIYIPISSMSGKLYRARPKLAKEIQLPESNKYKGERVYARIEAEDKEVAREMKDAISEFVEKYPTHGKVLQGMIAQKRLEKEMHLYFGVNEGRRLTAEDYLEVMKDLGFGEVVARGLYNELIEVSRSISRKRDEERSVLIGKN